MGRNGSGAIAFLALMLLAGFLIYKATYPEKLVLSDEAVYEQTFAAYAVVMSSLLTPSPTAYYTVTPTRTPYPPTKTPFPAYDASASPGIYQVPKWTPTPLGGTPIPEYIVPCEKVTPQPFDDIPCEVT